MEEKKLPEYLEILKQTYILQNSFNSKVDKEWFKNNFDWNTAIFIETAEAINSLAWKWWKKENNNLINLEIELVDIYHFLISKIIDELEFDKNKLESHFLANVGFINSFEIKKDKMVVDFNNRENVIKYVKKLRSFGSQFDIIKNNSMYFLFNFFDLWYETGNDIIDLLKKYRAKNALNFLRQNNGYKEGTYIKIWNDKEDNEFVWEYIKNKDLNENFLDDLYKELTIYYKENIYGKK